MFGFPSTTAEIEALPRSIGWRLSRAAAFIGGGLLLAPAVGVVPPHAPWVVAALGIGGFLGIRKWRERFTILSFLGSCPKCGAALAIKRGTPLKKVITVPCPGCNHDSTLTSDLSRESSAPREDSG
ncbi:MAG: hypothetical protein KJN92_15385 [Gemmatimonadetes bacterium]|nr:hypothetical protein [Gemmatimonadota bacterium]